MLIEERLDALERENEILKDRIAYLEAKGTDRWVTVKQLSEIMQYSTNHISVKAREGKLIADYTLGRHPRIPMSQFYKIPPEEFIIRQRRPKNKKDVEPVTMRDLVFAP